MNDAQFFEYVTMLLKNAGHMITSAPVYVNHTSDEALYIDSNENVIVSDRDRTLLSTISNISLITEVEWPGVIDELSEKIQFFSITVNESPCCRSQNVADIHYLLHKYWTCTHSIVFFKNFDEFIVSFADEYQSHILSDWFDIYRDYDSVIERVSIENISLETSDDYFDDCIYALAREYYLHPISFENASYGMIPTDFLVPKFNIAGDMNFDDEITKDDVKTMIQQNLIYFERIYGDDYVDPQYDGVETVKNYRSIANEIERISFELDLSGESDDNVFRFEDDVDVSFDDDYEDDLEFDDDLDDDVDPAIFDDPVLMVKWLENRHQQEQDLAEPKTISSNNSSNGQKTKQQKQVTEVRGNLNSSRVTPISYVSTGSTSFKSADEHINEESSILEELRKDAEEKRLAADRKHTTAQGKRQEAERLSRIYTELVECEDKRREQARITLDIAVAGGEELKQLKFDAERKRNKAEIKRTEAYAKRQEAERLAREYDVRKQLEAERKAREEAERKAREEAERKAREEAERKAREEAERKAREEAERKAREEAERKAREEAEHKAREEAERKAREEAERKAREEAEHKAREEAERKAREEAERKAREEVERKAREEAERKAHELERLKTEHSERISSINREHNANRAVIIEKLDIIAKRIDDIEKRIAKLNILQFVEKRNLKSELDELKNQQKSFIAQLSKAEELFNTQIAQENKNYDKLVSLI